MNVAGGSFLQDLFRRLPLRGGRARLAVPAGIAITLLAYAVRVVLAPHLPPGFPYVTFFPAVVISALVFGLWGGVASAVTGFGLARWFFVTPVGSLSLSGPAGWAMLLYAFVVVVDIIAIHSAQVAFGSLDEERRRNRDLARSRELLFHELQHRVGNNLQMVGSLLALQGRRVESGPARDAVDEAARRVRLVGKIQRTLYDPHGEQRSLSAVLEPMVVDIVDSAQGQAVTVQMDIRHDPLLLAEQAIPVALIVGEAVSNALEHAFALEGGGTITLRVERQYRDDERLLVIAVEDDGRGLPPDFDTEASSSLGLRIARALAAGMGGTFAVSPGAGSSGGVVSTLALPVPADVPEPATIH